MSPLLRRVFCLAAVALSGAAGAAEYLSVASPTVFYDAQSLKANKVFVASRYYPLEAMVKLSGWVKVRDYLGDIAWVEAKNLSDKRTLIVTAPQAEIYVATDTASGIAFMAERHVVVEPLEAASNGWVKVKHRDGQVGYVKTEQVWGL
jgi:SH3-like domain-containing protein